MTEATVIENGLTAVSGNHCKNPAVESLEPGLNDGDFIVDLAKR
jgi:hypothetical protein